MSTLDLEFHRRLAKRIAEETDGEMNSLKSGALPVDAYHRKCGTIRAYEDMKEWCRQIEHNIAEGK